MALKGFKKAEIAGLDTNPETVRQALAAGAIDRAYESGAEAAAASNLLILCVYPHYILDFMKENAAFLKPGTIVSDVCGTAALVPATQFMISRKVLNI